MTSFCCCEALLVPWVLLKSKEDKSSFGMCASTPPPICTLGVPKAVVIRKLVRSFSCLYCRKNSVSAGVRYFFLEPNVDADPVELER